LARRPDRDLRCSRMPLRVVGRPRAPARVLRPAALPHGCRRGRVLGAGPAPLLRLLRGDADPALRADRRVGRRRPPAGDDHVRRLHRRRLAPHARRDRRVRPPAGDVRPDPDGDERERLALPRLRGRVRGEGAAVAVPRLAPRRLPRVAGGGGGAALGRGLEGRGLRVPADRDREVPGAGPRLPRAAPRARLDRARLRLAARLPGARRPRRRRVLVARADGPDHVRPLRRERPRARRRGAPDGEPRADLDHPLPARGHGRAARRDRRARAARRDGTRAAGARDRADDDGGDRARRAALLELRGRVPDPRRRLPPGLGLGGRRRGRDRARGPVHAAADLRRAARRAGAGGDAGGARPARRRARDRRPARRLPARALGLAGGDLRPRADAGAGGLDLPHARLPGVPVIRRPHVDWFALSPSLVLTGVAGLLLLVAVLAPRHRRKPLAAAGAGAGFVAAFALAVALAARSPHPATAVADAVFRDRWAALAQALVAACGGVAVLLSYGERWREEHVAEYYALLAAGGGMAFFVQASNLMTLFLGLEWFSIALYVLCAIDIDLVGSLEAGLKYLIV